MSDKTIISFHDACRLLCQASSIRLDGHSYIVKLFQSDGGPLVLQRHPEPETDQQPLLVWFLPKDNAIVPADSAAGSLTLREEAGEDANLEFEGPVSVFTTAETAAAIMDAFHSEVCQQDEGSDSAYEELNEAATRAQLGFPAVWSWTATLASAARPRMEALWVSGEVEFIDCVQVAAQLFHNFITVPGNENKFTDATAEAIWEQAAKDVIDHMTELKKDAAGN